jgi:hypothetical protein
MTNLFPLPYWAPALKRVPILLQALDDAFRRGDSGTQAACISNPVFGVAGPRYEGELCPFPEGMVNRR